LFKRFLNLFIMSYQREYVKALLKKYLERKTSPLEKAILMEIWQFYDTKEIAEMMEEIEPYLEPFVDEEVERKIQEWEPSVEEIIRRGKKADWQRRIKWVINALPAAAVYILIAMASWFFTRLMITPPKLKYECSGVTGGREIPTGAYSCGLTLSNNCYMLIDSTYRGMVAREGNTKIVKTQSGVLVYQKSDKADEEDTAKQRYNTISTSPGDQYQVILSDGTKIRLNAASSIRFPVAFPGNHRWVQIKGEAFFDVAPDKNRPFYVRVPHAEIRVLGTSFNVNAYSSTTVTTLISGSLALANGTDSVRLQPGQEAIVRNSLPDEFPARIVVQRADTTEVLSWKTTIRLYKNVTIKDFVQDMGRWYKLEIVNADCIPNRHVFVRLCYAAPLNEILKLFQKMGLQFRMEGSKIIFCPPA
jgi:hypothetical protein